MSFQAMAWAVAQKGIRPLEKLVLLALANYASNSAGECYPSMATLADDTGMSRDSVIRAIKAMEDAGLLRVIRRREGDVNLPNVYRLALQGVVADSDHSPQTAGGGSRSQRLGVVADSDPNLSVEPIPTVAIAPVGKARKPADVSSRGTRLPADWKPDAELMLWARTERPDVDCEMEAEAFADYWRSQPGQKGSKLDWPATFRNWIRRAKARPSAAKQQARDRYGGPLTMPERMKLAHDEQRAREARLVGDIARTLIPARLEDGL